MISDPRFKGFSAFRLLSAVVRESHPNGVVEVTMNRDLVTMFVTVRFSGVIVGRAEVGADDEEEDIVFQLAETIHEKFKA